MSARNSREAKAARRLERTERKDAFRSVYEPARRALERRHRCAAKLQAAMGRRPRRSTPPRFVVDVAGVVEDLEAAAPDSAGITTSGAPA